MVTPGIEPGFPWLHKLLYSCSEFFVTSFSSPDNLEPHHVPRGPLFQQMATAVNLLGPLRALGLPETLQPPESICFCLLRVLPFALDGKTSLSVVVNISKGPAGPQDIRWSPVPGMARCFRCIDFYQLLTPIIYEKYLAPKYACFEGTSDKGPNVSSQ